MADNEESGCSRINTSNTNRNYRPVKTNGLVSYRLYRLLLGYLLDNSIPTDDALKKTELLSPLKLEVRSGRPETESHSDSHPHVQPDSGLNFNSPCDQQRIVCSEGENKCETAARSNDLKSPCETASLVPQVTLAAKDQGMTTTECDTPELINCNIDDKSANNGSQEAVQMRNAVDRARKLFFSWAKRVYIKEEKKDSKYVSVSLMSKWSKKEIVPMESCKELILNIHSQYSKPGQCHLTVEATVLAYREQYSFGHRDFGVSEEAIRKTIAECDDLLCYAKIHCKFQKSAENRSNVNPASWESFQNNILIPKLPPLMSVTQDPYYQDIAQIIVAQDQELLLPQETWIDQNLRRQVLAIKRAGNPLYYARTLKRKMSEAGILDGNPQVIPRQTNPAEELSFNEAYSCLVAVVKQMRKEFIYSCNGERRHHDNIQRSLTAAQVLVRQCLLRQKRETRIEQSP